MRTLFVTLLVAVTVLGHAAAGEVKPLKVFTWADFADLSDKEKDTYVTGLLEGQSFMLFSASHPSLEMFVKCVQTEGVTKIRKFTETLTVLHPDELKWPIPWAVSKALGTACAKYRERKSGAVREGEKTREYKAASVRVLNRSATMHYQKGYMMTVVSGIVGSEGIPEVISLGDVIKVKGETLKVNHIFVTEYFVDMKWGKEVLARKGDIDCVIVEREEDVPSDDEDRDRLWIHVKQCKPVG